MSYFETQQNSERRNALTCASFPFAQESHDMPHAGRQGRLLSGDQSAGVSWSRAELSG